jgi:hypothetical protein
MGEIKHFAIFFFLSVKCLNSFLIKNLGEPRKPGESGGNVNVVCNKIINGQKWTIVSDGADGSEAFKWTKENFEELFPSISTSDKEEAMNSVLTKLAEILPTENRTKGENILPGHKGNFLISGTTDDSSEITATFYGGKKQKQTLISIASMNQFPFFNSSFTFSQNT